VPYLEENQRFFNMIKSICPLLIYQEQEDILLLFIAYIGEESYMKRKSCIREHAFKREGVIRHISENVKCKKTLMTVALNNAGICNYGFYKRGGLI
jgi:hypothetical protein